MKKFLSFLFVLSFSFGALAQTTATVVEPLQGSLVPQVAVNKAGDMAVVWAQNLQTAGYPIIFAATKGATDSSFVVQRISTGTVSNQLLQFASSPQVVIDESGNAVALWQQTNLTFFSNNVLYAAVKIKGETNWRTPVAVSKPTYVVNFVSQSLTSTRTPQLFIDASGNATALWSQFNVTTNCFMAYSSTLSTTKFTATPTPWSDPVQLSTTATTGSTTRNLFDVSNPVMAFNNKGSQVVVWSQVNNVNGAAMIFVRSKSPTPPTFGSPVQLSTTSYTTSNNIRQTLQDATLPQVGMDDSGRAVVVWTQLNQSLGFNMIFVSYQLNDGKWTTPLQLSQTTFGTPVVANLAAASNPQLVLDGKGNVVVIWQQINGLFGNNAVLYSTSASRAASGSLVWQTPIQVSTRSYPFSTNPNNQTLLGASSAQITMDSASTATAIWSQQFDLFGNSMILRERLPLNAKAWDTTTLFRISLPTTNAQTFSTAITPQIDINASGLVTVVWSQTNTNLQFAQIFLQTNPGPSTNTSPILLSKTNITTTVTVP